MQLNVQTHMHVSKHAYARIHFIYPPPPPLKKVPTPMLNLKAVEVYCICNKMWIGNKNYEKGYVRIGYQVWLLVQVWVWGIVMSSVWGKLKYGKEG